MSMSSDAIRAYHVTITTHFCYLNCHDAYSSPSVYPLPQVSGKDDETKFQIILERKDIKIARGLFLRKFSIQGKMNPGTP